MHRETNLCLRTSANGTIIDTCDSANNEFKWEPKPFE